MKLNGVFDSGGMKGIATIGALNYLENKHIKWCNLAGSSVGALIASFIFAGYTSKDLKHMITSLKFNDFIDKETIARIPIMGKGFNFIKDNGIYSGNFIEKWIDDCLKSKGINTFSDIINNSNYKLKIIIADITKKSMVTFPDDLYLYGLSPSTFKVSKAIRMSISIPLFFKPVKLIHGSGISYMMDGSICCSYPINIFDSDNNLPTIGFKFDNSYKSNTSLGKKDILSFLFDIADTMNKDFKNNWINQKNLYRSILIPTNDVDATDFHINKSQIINLFKNGYKACENFWINFNEKEYFSLFKNKETTAYKMYPMK